MSGRILVVDDETDVAALFRQAFRRDLKQGRFALDFAHSATEALAKIGGGKLRGNTGGGKIEGGRTEGGATEEGQPFALVLSDINMPGRSGFDLVNECRAAHPELPVLLISAYGDEATRTNAMRCGAVGLLSKPIDFRALRTEIEARVV